VCCFLQCWCCVFFSVNQLNHYFPNMEFCYGILLCWNLLDFIPASFKYSPDTIKIVNYMYIIKNCTIPYFRKCLSSITFLQHTAFSITIRNQCNFFSYFSNIWVVWLFTFWEVIIKFCGYSKLLATLCNVIEKTG
jgi:hypothetical protein